MKIQHTILALALAIGPTLHPGAAQSADLIFEPEVSMEFDDNVFANTEDEFEDVVYRARPRVLIEDRDGSFQYGFRYEPAFEAFARADGIANWEHSFRMTGQWRLSPQTVLTFDDRFDRLTSAGRFNEITTDADGDPATDIVFGRRRFKRNSASLNLEHQFRPNHFLAVNADHFFQDYGTLSSGEVESISAGLQYNYALSAADRIGVGFSYTQQEFEDFGFQDDSETDFYYLYGSWTHEFDPTLSMSISAGPTFVHTDSPSSGLTTASGQFQFPVLFDGTDFRYTNLASCDVEGGIPVLSGCSPLGPALSELELAVSPRVTLSQLGSIPDPDDTDVTFFANAVLNKKWGRWTTRFSYRRQANSSSQFGTSTVSDTFHFTGIWQPSPRWWMTIQGVYFNREQSGESQILVTALRPSAVAPVAGAAEAFGFVAVETDNAIDTDQWNVGATVDYRWNRRLTFFATAFYLENEEDGDFGFNREIDRFRLFFGVRYTFDRIHLY